MSEMVERLVLASFRVWQAHNPDKQKFTIDDMLPEEREFADIHARAILEELRDPTESMLKAGAKGCGEDRQEVAGGAWVAMIDAALK